jgi:hypothetical protein
MALYASWVLFADEASVLDAHLRAFAASRPSMTSASGFSLPDECLLEGLLSRVWQSWGLFCRSCVIESCMGTVDGSGAHVAPHPFSFSEAHVSGAAVRAKTKKVGPPYWGGTNTMLRHEPTWGDVDVLARVIPRLGCANQSQLLAAFSSGSQSAKAIQRIRNAAAHRNSETMLEVMAIRSRYGVFPVTHPVHALFWTEPSSGDFLVTAAVEVLVESAFDAIS